MKQFTLTLLLALSFQCINAQNLCDGHEKPIGGVPEERFRGRLDNGQMYGNPYTLMDRTKFPNANDGFIAIRTAIIKDVRDEGVAGLYKAILTEASRPLFTRTCRPCD